MHTVLLIASIVSVSGSMAATIHVLLFYRRATTAVAWLFAIWMIPILAPVAYLMLSVYEGPRRIRRRRRAAVQFRKRRAFRLDDGTEMPRLPEAAELVRLDRAQTPFSFLPGHHLEILPDSDASLSGMLAAIEGAKQEILLQTFILQAGEVLEAMIDRIASRRRDGVAVRLLIDPIGTVSLPRSVSTRLEECGVKVAAFLKPNPLKGRFQVNFRNHRKLLAVDGKLAFLGGRNLSDDYFDRDGGRRFRDLSVAVRGPSVVALRRVFEEDWALATDHEDDPGDLDGPLGSLTFDSGGSWARPYPLGPDESALPFTDVLATAISRASKSVFIVSPYFAPGPALQSRLRCAALAGVDVTLLISDRSDLWIGDHAARHFAREIAAAGANILFRPDRFVHAKAIVIDDAWATFGSMNFDQRSFQLNYELNLEVLDAGFARALRAYFDADVADSRRLDPNERPRLWRRLAERGSALFEPLL